MSDTITVLIVDTQAAIFAIKQRIVPIDDES